MKLRRLSMSLRLFLKQRTILCSGILAVALAVPVFTVGLTASAFPGVPASENAAPVAENLSLKTYKNVAITGRFSAVDPEGDLITFQLLDKPARGAVTMPEGGEGNI